MYRGFFKMIGGLGDTFTSNPDDAPKVVRYATFVHKTVNQKKNIDFHTIVNDILDDPRSWGGIKDYKTKFIKIMPDMLTSEDLKILLCSQAYVDVGCPGTGSKGLSCCNLENNTIYVNSTNWWGGNNVLENSGLSLDDYRRYVINHEVGHFLRLGHSSCDAAIKTDGNNPLVPVMVQQSLPDKVKSCIPNPWPRKTFPH